VVDATEKKKAHSEKNVSWKLKKQREGRAQGNQSPPAGPEPLNVRRSRKSVAGEAESHHHSVTESQRVDRGRYLAARGCPA
jgi:hypothetical protein